MTKRRKDRRGVVLLTTLFFMILFAMLSFALYQLSPSENRSALREKTLTEGHFACTAGIRNVKEWVSAVSKPTPATATSDPNWLGQDWADGTNFTAGTFSVPRAHNDPFSVPTTDPNFTQTSLAALDCPYGRFSGQSGVDFLGLLPGVNLSDADYNTIKSRQANWPAIRSVNPLVVGDFQVHSFIIPSAPTLEIIASQSGSGLRTYLVVCIAYRNQMPVMRTRCLLQEQTAARYAYRANVGNTDIMGNPVTWNVVNNNSVLFDGPVHTNEVPYVNVPSTYWNSALQYFAGDTITKKRPKRAFMGPVTFSGTSTILTTGHDFDGMGWFGGNYSGTDTGRRPFDATGNPIASSAQGANPNPASGPIVNRYDRLVEGGRQAISRISSVPLPQNLTSLKVGAFGDQAVTGLDPAAAQVTPTQRNGAIQQATVTTVTGTPPPGGWRNSSGGTISPTTHNNGPSADNGIFVNPKSGSNEVAGGVVVKGDARSMFLEVTDANGKVITDMTTLQNGTAAGNPTIRVQASQTSYDSNSGTDIYHHVQQSTWNPPVWNPPGSPTWIPTVAASYVATVATVPGYTQAGAPGYTQAGASPLHSPVTACPAPNYTPPSGGGSGSGTYNCPHVGTPTWVPTGASTWIATVNGAAGYTVATVPGYTQSGAAGYTTPGYTSNTWVPTGSPIGKNPHQYKAQDWVVDVKNVATTIQPSIPLPTGSDASGWRFGVGTEINVVNSGHNTKTAPLLGEGSEPVPANSGVTEVWVHDTASDVTGRKVTSPEPIGVGKILVYKQSRSDANRVDVFVLDRPGGPPSGGIPDGKPGLNGAVFGTGDIHGLRGVNMERKTIGVEYGNSAATEKGIAIIDTIWQFGTPKGSKPNNANNGLGLVAPKMNIQTREGYFNNSTKPLYVYATIIAGSANQTSSGGAWPYQGLEVSRANNDNTANFTLKANTTDTSAANRLLQIFGGLTEQQTKARLDGNRGWGQQMNFDPQLSYFPPPFFPTTNTLVPLAFTQESVLGR